MGKQKWGFGRMLTSFPSGPMIGGVAEEKATKESVLERVQFLSGQEYEKREFSEKMRI